MRELTSFECFKVGGAGTAKLTLDDIKTMLEDNYTTQKIGAIGLKTATEEAKPSWGNNVAGDAGYYYLANGRVTRWFFDGVGYFTE